MPDLLATIPKNNTSEVRVMLSEYKGNRLLDVRVFSTFDDGAERVATRKGVSINIEKLAELREALHRAECAARVKGWLPQVRS